MFITSEKFEEGLLDALSQLGIDTEENRDYQIYTIRHKQAFMALQVELLGSVDKAGIFHDTDKLILYGIMPKEAAHNMHLLYSTHHIANTRNDKDKEYSVIDYECARLTKPDKPLNAYSTIHKIHSSYIDELTPILIKLGLNSDKNIDYLFDKWLKQRDELLEKALDMNIRQLSLMYNNLVNLGIDRAMQLFYH